MAQMLESPISGEINRKYQTQFMTVDTARYRPFDSGDPSTRWLVYRFSVTRGQSYTLDFRYPKLGGSYGVALWNGDAFQSPQDAAFIVSTTWGYFMEGRAPDKAYSVSKYLIRIAADSPGNELYVHLFYRPRAEEPVKQARAEVTLRNPADPGADTAQLMPGWESVGPQYFYESFTNYALQLPRRAMTVRSVVSGAGFRPAIASGSWVAIIGAGLSATTRMWSSADFAGDSLPVTLDGVSVTINSKPAAVYYVSPGQVNVLAPDDDAVGPVNVQITNGSGSGSITVEKRRAAPEFFTFGPEGGRYAAAVHSDGTLACKASLYAGACRPAAAGEVIVLYGTGFGKTDPAVSSSNIVRTPARLAATPRILFGEAEAEVIWAGLVSPGLYQLNVRVPAHRTGDVPVTAEQSGERSPSGVFVSVE
jgi:uncharacterized protein (TIGR03437 family)